MTAGPSDRDVLLAKLDAISIDQRRIISLLEELLQGEPTGPTSLVTEDAVAKTLGVSVVTLRRYRRRGAIGYLRIAGSVLYRREHIDSFLASAEHKQRAGLRRNR